MSHHSHHDHEHALAPRYRDNGYGAAINETLDVVDAIEIMAIEDNRLMFSEEDLLADIEDVTAFEIDEAIDQVLSGNGAKVNVNGHRLDAEDLAAAYAGLGVSVPDNLEGTKPVENGIAWMNEDVADAHVDVEVPLAEVEADAAAAVVDNLTAASNDTRAIQNSSFLHRACLDKRVTLEVIEYLVDVFPEAAEILTDEFCPKKETNAYPLHLACYNENCPSSVIELLVKKNPEALSHLCIVEVGVRGEGDDGEEYVEGLPLHYYLSRESNRDFATVKLLVDAYRGALTTAGDESRFAPLHTLVCNPNEEDLYETAAFLVKTEPSSLRLTDRNDQVPLHIACTNKSMTPGIVALLLEQWPQSFAQQDNCGGIPLHTLCYTNDGLDESVSMEILKLLIAAAPSSVRHADSDGDLPIHIAADNKSPEFCKILIDAWYPDAVRFESDDGILPVHQACGYGRVETVEYLLDLYPQGIKARTNAGFLPIHEAAYRLEGSQAEIVEMLLEIDPSQAASLAADGDHLPLHLACDSDDVDLRAVQLLFDAHPDAVTTPDGEGRNPLEIARAQNVPTHEVISFLERQMAYALQSKDAAYMSSTDFRGRLPLHNELLDDAPLRGLLPRRKETAARRKESFP